MNTGDEARILIVDDQPEEARALQGALGDDYAVDVYEPDEVTADALLGADVVLVDYDLSNWEAAVRDDQPARSPADGLALAAVLRSHAMPDYHKRRPVAFALHSSQLDRIGGSLPQEVREHALARVHNLEWVFDKNAERSFGVPPLAERVRQLAAAVRALPDNWPPDPDEAQDAIASLLGWRTDMPGAAAARDHVMRCHPPLHELSVATDGLTCLRWLAHRILPYPCFLSDGLHVAVRLGLDPAEIHAASAGKDDGLAQALEASRYRGVLAEFVGPRWWRGGIDDWLWSLGSGSLEGPALHAELERVSGRPLRPLGINSPVVVLDEQYLSMPTPIGVDNAIRVQPDDWPPFADDAWTTLQLVNEHARLRDQVVPNDRDLLVEQSAT